MRQRAQNAPRRVVAERVPADIPGELTSFVGRRGELGEVKSLLAGARLLTLTGTGGVGKTRLALRAAQDAARKFRDGVRLVELSALEEPALCTDAIAGALGLRDDTGHWSADALGAHIGPRQMLLVLDNCEHVVDAVAGLTASLLRACPQLKILATSRQVLGLPGEVVFRVPSLSVPDEDAAVGREFLMRFEAVRLFATRAAEARRGFTVTPANMANVVLLCRRLDGIPLAIELAAARLRSMTLEQILERLDDRFRLLSTGVRSVPSRQQTLRATIEWSYGLLGLEERGAWRRLSVFNPTFELAAAEAVEPSPGGSAAFVLDLVTGLVDRSILVFEERRNRRPVYRMGETLRQFGREQLMQAGEERETRRKHRDWYLRLATEAAGSWLGRGNVEWLDRLHVEHDNLRLALEFCLSEPGQAQTGLQLASSLWMYWSARGHVGEGRHWLTVLLAADSEPTLSRTSALLTAGVLCRVQGDYPAARHFLDEAVGSGERLGDMESIGLAKAELAIVAAETDSRARSIELLEEVLVFHRKPGDRVHRSYVEYMASLMNWARQPNEAVRLLEEALRLSEEAGDDWRRCWALRMLGAAAWIRGDRRQAQEHVTTSLSLARDNDDWRGIASALELLSWIAAEGQDATERAARLLGAADKIWASVGASSSASWKPERVRALETIESRLGAGACQKALQRGSEMTLKEAIRYALEEKLPTATSAARGGPEQAVLSRREKQVADLVAEGLSNKAIAARLFISVRTAETHVQNVLIKLGLNSRLQLTLWRTELEGSAERTK